MIHPTLFSGPAYKTLRIGLLGGSFNPAHDAHIAMSLHAIKRLQLDQVWWLVSPQNPLKSQHNMAKLEARVAKAQAITAPHPRIQVTTFESQLGTRFTTDTLTQLKRRYPHTRFIWLMGADNLHQFGRWKQWDAIFYQVPIAVFIRPGYAAGRLRSKAAGRFDRFWHATHTAKSLASQQPPAWLMLDNKRDKLSATNLRQQQRIMERGDKKEKGNKDKKETRGKQKASR